MNYKDYYEKTGEIMGIICEGVSYNIITPEQAEENLSAVLIPMMEEGYANNTDPNELALAIAIKAGFLPKKTFN